MKIENIFVIAAKCFIFMVRDSGKITFLVIARRSGIIPKNCLILFLLLALVFFLQKKLN